MSSSSSTSNPDYFIASCVIAIVYIVSRYLEMRIMKKETIPLKVLFRDTLIVYVCAITGLFLMEQLNSIMQSGIGLASSALPSSIVGHPPAFTGEADF